MGGAVLGLAVGGCTIEGTRQRGDECLQHRECVPPLRCEVTTSGLSLCVAPTRLDAGPRDAPAPDTGPGDSSAADAGPGDATPGEAGAGDAGPGDAGRGDAGPAPMDVPAAPDVPPAQDARPLVDAPMTLDVSVADVGVDAGPTGADLGAADADRSDATDAGDPDGG